MKESATSQPSAGGSTAGASTKKMKSIPSDYGEVRAGIGQHQYGGFLNYGKPFASHASEYAFWDGRYGDLNADPLFTGGADIRAAYWTGTSSFFPMQYDLHGALHRICN